MNRAQRMIMRVDELRRQGLTLGEALDQALDEEAEPKPLPEPGPEVEKSEAEDRGEEDPGAPPPHIPREDRYAHMLNDDISRYLEALPGSSGPRIGSPESTPGTARAGRDGRI